MRLLSLTLHNFKGIRDLRLDLQGRDTSIYGANGTGKTSLADAFSWLLFGKDSKDKADFDIKTLDADNNPLPGLDHEVEAELDLGGTVITLKKSYKEVWTKRRGEAAKTFTGHTTDHFINGVPVQKKEYDAAIADIAPEDIFKLLTDPRRFNALHWQDRRKMLLDVCGDVSDADVIASDKALATLPDILGKRSLDDHRKVIAARRTEINRELDKIPVRIDEATRAMPELPGKKRDTYEKELKALQALADKKAAERLRIESGGEVAEKKRALAELDAELLEIKTGLRVDIDAGIASEQTMIRQRQRAIGELRAEIDELERRIDWSEERIAEKEKRMTVAREDWKDVNARTFEFEQEDVCPTCGQALPKDQIEAARKKALEQFNTKKASDLERITGDGKAMATDVQELQAEIAALEKDITKHREDLARQEEIKAEAEKRLAKLEQQAAEIETDSAYTEKLEGRQVLLDAIAALQAGSDEELQKVLSESIALAEQIESTKADIAKFDARKAGEARIKELGEEERALAAELETLEMGQDLCDEFVRAKVRLLDEKINSKFELARFKMFEVQINGGLSETCETMHNGIPWSTGMNNGAQINVGVDIINTLSEHYSFTAPIIVDNAESVTDITPTRAQLIRLVVSKPDKVLRIEYEEEKNE